MTNPNAESDRMFAVVSSDDQMPVFVKQGCVGYWPCTQDKYLAWGLMHANQGEAVTESALRGSMIGWDNPAAKRAVNWTGYTSPNTLESGE